LELAANIVALAATAGGYAGFKMATVPVKMSAAQLQTVSSQVKQQLKDVAKDLAETAAENLAKEVVNSAYNQQEINWAAVDPTGIAAVVQAFARAPC
jgi:hypothetical protein